ncbi:MAG: hypothetical protein M3N07_06475 [Pseudomonadota bacterium]|nr:hypothetical protein [Pseudomonadota bacterium]
MSPHFTIPAFGAAVLAAVALGVHLGESAIDQINPIYFQGPAVHPRDRGAAIDPNALPPQRPAFAELYGWDEGEAARTADCAACPPIGARDFYAEAEAAFAVLDSGWADEPAAAYVEVQPTPEEEPEREPTAWAEIDRYTSYPIEEKRAPPRGETFAAAD